MTTTQKPIVRWTVHKGCAKSGLECLSRAIASWHAVYQDSFECYICANQHFDELETFKKKDGIRILYQSQYTDSLPIPPFRTTWKFYPPRINPDVPEIILDNDLMIYKRSPTIDAFLTSNSFLTSQSHIRHYGQFDGLIRSTVNINTGIMGIPAGYDLKGKMSKFLKLYCGSKGWVSHNDDQGVFAYLMLQHLWQLVPLTEISIVNPSVVYAHYKVGTSGIHFAGLNWGHDAFYKLFLESDINLCLQKQLSDR